MKYNTMKYWIPLYFFLSTELFASDCFNSFHRILFLGTIENRLTLATLGIYNYQIQTEGIIRFGIPKNHKNEGKLQGLFEVDISNLKSLHPIPNPIRKNSTHSLESLLSILSSDGFDLGKPIQVAVMPDLSLRIIGGHHRTIAMKLLEEKTIPAEIYIWRRIHKGTRTMYREEFIEPLKRTFPEYYQDLISEPDLFD